MSFHGHAREFRTRLMWSLIGYAGAFALTVSFANDLWGVISRPAINAVKTGAVRLPVGDTAPMEQFAIIWLKIPMVVSIFLASPVGLYQVWGAISTHLDPHERRWALPFVLCNSSIFVGGGLLGYFVVLPVSLSSCFGTVDASVRTSMVSEYFGLFASATLGSGISLQLPVMIFFLTLVRITTPSLLISYSRQAILGIVLLAAMINPIPGVFNLILFTLPMVVLYFVGVGASYLLNRIRS
jgi:sec-independent protein translocase protein TatC